MNLTYKYAKVTDVHTDNGDRTLGGLITSEMIDEDGEVVLASGADTEYHERLRGCSVLWNHDLDVPVGKMRALTPKGLAWYCSAFISRAKGHRVLCDDVLTMAREGILHWSMGFKRLDHGAPTREERDRFPGIKYITRKWRLMELTLTPVPAHADARVVTKSLSALAQNGAIRRETVREFAPSLSVEWDAPKIEVPDMAPLAIQIPKW